MPLTFSSLTDNLAPNANSYQSIHYQPTAFERRKTVGFAQIAGLKIHYQAVSDPKVKKGQRVMSIHGTGCNGKV